MNSYVKFQPIIEANCQAIHEMIRLKGLTINTLTLLYRHFLSHQISIDTSAIQCSPGCAFCCYLRVTASMPEVLIIYDFLYKNKQIDLYREHIEDSPDVLASRRNKDLSWWAENRVPCLFLDIKKQHCKIYEVRPFTCRSYHSLDAEQCKKGYSQKEIVPIPCYPDVKRSFEVYSISFEQTMRQLGRQSAQRELSSTMALLIKNPDLINRWLTGDEIIPS